QASEGKRSGRDSDLAEHSGSADPATGLDQSACRLPDPDRGDVKGHASDADVRPSPDHPAAVPAVNNVHKTVMQGKKLLDSIPPYVSALWGKAVAAALQGLMFAIDVEGPRAAVEAIENLRILPYRVLCVPPKGAGLGSHVSATIRAYLRDEDVPQPEQQL